MAFEILLAMPLFLKRSGMVSPRTTMRELEALIKEGIYIYLAGSLSEGTLGSPAAAAAAATLAIGLVEESSLLEVLLVRDM